jgi:23S rRNA (adenine2503-C2)-methyltransferase
MLKGFMAKRDIKDFTLDSLNRRMLELDEPRYRARQIFEWIYKKGVMNFAFMTNISKASRQKLKDNFMNRSFEAEEFKSEDGTLKLRFPLDKESGIESVLIPMNGKWTLCISSQVGWALNCRFCFTGKMGFKRNLETWEIVEQVGFVNRKYGKDKKISNIVLMGMGEPLLNYKNVIEAIGILKEEEGLRFAGRKITVSTAGITSAISKLGQDEDVKLAVSLNASNDKVRDFLMPINKKFPMKGLLKKVRNYPIKRKTRVTFEYVMIKGVNDHPDHAKELSHELRKIPSKVNLIPFNSFPKSKFKAPDIKSIEKFRAILEKQSILSTIRKSKGSDICGACGQLIGKR